MLQQLDTKATDSVSDLGIEIKGLNLNSKLPKEVIEKIRSAWLENGVAVFPNQDLTHDQFENFSLEFGNFGDDPFLGGLEEKPNIVEVKRLASEKASPFGGGWHSDWSFQSNPPAATFLLSKIIPPVGGDTLFANTQKAYEDLDDEMKLKINNLKVVHSAKLPYADDGFYATEKETRSMNIITSKEAKKEQIHPLVKTHPETQKKGLFINPVYTSRILDVPDEESFLLLSTLYEHMTQEKYVFRHKWSENMLLMWDNRTVMHMAEGGYDGYDRLLHRITIANAS
ncbi:MAG: TauD/TfdA family dioxygenase [Gammaproteobacteria bacterium]|nr:MAG: TauD/TfdA family dioxygenase [Gammaproteobacteria bacterium]|tara:strand:+ start:424 stop:1275 length:852 start_codon:yes stop_codon:yes gene_type:complete